MSDWIQATMQQNTINEGKFELSAQENALTPFVGNRTKVNIPSEIKPPLYSNK
jgi:hypothetical protein